MQVISAMQPMDNPATRKSQSRSFMYAKVTPTRKAAAPQALGDRLSGIFYGQRRVEKEVCSHQTNGKNESNTNLAVQGDVEAPNNLLWQDQKDDIGEEVEGADGEVERPSVVAVPSHSLVPDSFKRHADEVAGNTGCEIEQYIDPECD